MQLRSLMIAALLLPALSVQANALTCDQVRRAIKDHGEAAVLWYAKLNGFSDKRIARIKRNCKLERF
jgi:hypothetical protein